MPYTISEESFLSYGLSRSGPLGGLSDSCHLTHFSGLCQVSFGKSPN